ncbi:MAG: hypothetical protein ACFFFH_08595 [Candidatus Thorarchaeota archaeon]
MSICKNPEIRTGLPKLLELSEGIILIFFLITNFNLFIPALAAIVMLNLAIQQRKNLKNKKLVNEELKRSIWNKEFKIYSSQKDKSSQPNKIIRHVIKIGQVKLSTRDKYSHFNKSYATDEFNLRTRQDFQMEILTNEIMEFTDLIVIVDYNEKWIICPLIPLEYYNIDYLIGETRIYQKYTAVKKLLKIIYKQFPTTKMDTKQVYHFAEGYFMTPLWVDNH